MQDLEFTVQQGVLHILQTRSGKRTAEAALRMAVEMADEGLITRDEALCRIDPNALDQLLTPRLIQMPKNHSCARPAGVTRCGTWQNCA